MKNNKTIFEVIENQIMGYQKSYIIRLIQNIWLSDDKYYNIEIYNIDYINLSNYYIPFSEFKTVVKYKIPENICYEYWDWLSLNYESDRCKEFEKTLPDDCKKWTLYLFYNFCMKDDKEWMKYKKEDLKKSEKKVKEAKEMLEDILKNT